MKAFVGVTDGDWYQLLASDPAIEEVNFWQPGGSRTFAALQAGELFLFKLHSPRDYIVGGGVFAHSTLLPVSLAWDAFGKANGATTLSEMRGRIEHYRRRPEDAQEDYVIGCILLTQPFFLEEDLWIPVPSDWSRNIVQGKSYDLDVEPGATLFSQLQQVMAPTEQGRNLSIAHDLPKMAAGRYGSPTLVTPRLGQGTFRVVVTDAYSRRCAISGEKVLPVLQASHIKPFASGGEHRTDNGILLRSDLHTLFDRGYVTVTPDLRLEVSRRIREEFDNGEHYYALRGGAVRSPGRPENRPASVNLAWHNEHMFKA